MGKEPTADNVISWSVLLGMPLVRRMGQGPWKRCGHAQKNIAVKNLLMQKIIKSTASCCNSLSSLGKKTGYRSRQIRAEILFKVKVMILRLAQVKSYGRTFSYAFAHGQIYGAR